MRADTSPTDKPGIGWISSGIEWLVEVLLAAFVWFAIDALGHWRISPTAFAMTAGMAWVVPLSIQRLVPLGRLWCLGYAAAMTLSASALALAGPFLREPLSVGQISYAVVLVFGVIAIWRSWLSLTVGDPKARCIEALRRLLVGAAAAWAVLAFFTPQHLGGVDARWYAYMLKDFLEQARAGTFPVFLGLGETAYNGAAHPVRTAPLFMWIGGILDILTARDLELFAIQHLTVVAASLVAGLGMYAALSALGPARRWSAAGVAALYVLCPGVLAPIYNSDMYMTYMATAMVPLVIYGNGRSLTDPAGCGFLALAAGLSLVWMAHPPVAFSLTLASVLLQGGRLVLDDASVGHWRRLLGGAAAFISLSLYYFYSMAELPPRPGPNFRPDAVMLAGVLTTIVGAGRWMAGRHWRWLGLIVVGAPLLAYGREAWVWWLAVFAPTALAIGGGLRWSGHASPARALDGVWAAALLAAAGAIVAGAGRLPNPEVAALRELEAHARGLARYFLPIDPETYRGSDFQPGTSLWALLAVAFVVAWAGRDLKAKLWTVAAGFLVVVIIPIPAVSEFLVGFGPPAIMTITGCPLPLRMGPVLAALTCAAVFAGLVLRVEGRSGRIAVGVMITVGVTWSAWEARKFVQRGWRATSAPAMSAAHLRTENIPLHRFAYDLLPLPDYFSEGTMDGRLEPRLLGVDHRPRIGPDEIAAAMEAQRVRSVRLEASETEPPAKGWLQLSPTLTLEPGEHVLLRFDFEPQEYLGHLVFKGDRHSYREYYLPQWGMPKSFGTNPDVPKVLSLWNSGDAPETYNLFFITQPGHEVAREGGHFATVYISRYDPLIAPVRVETWNPLRIAVETAEPGFLETPRVMIPGYAAQVNDRPVSIERSPHRLVMVPVSPGRNVVEIDYVGTWKLWTAAALSGLAWLGLLARTAWVWKSKYAAGRPPVEAVPVGGRV
jgi:hypothetical protein